MTHLGLQLPLRTVAQEEPKVKNGRAIGHIHLPERCPNVAFGGRKRNRLFMAASKSLYAVYVNTQGVVGG